MTTYSGRRTTNPALSIFNTDLIMLSQDLSGTKTTTMATALEMRQYFQTGLENVDNTSDINKPVSTAQTAAIAAMGATKEPSITEGTTTEYWRGDKTWQTLAVDASQIVSGTINISRLPAASVERLSVVVDEAARYALTTAEVQNGDTVKQSSDGLMFFVKDATNLSNSAGYEPYTTGAAASVPWSGVTSTPTTLSGYGITDAATTSDLSTTNSTVSGKEPTITAGTTDQYWRGDKSWQTLPTALTNPMTAVGDIIYGGASGAPTRLGIGTSGYVLTASSGNPVWQLLDKTSVGLSNVDNTSDVNKPISTATQTALDTKPTKTAVNLYTKNQTVTPFTLTSGSTVSVDASQSNNFKLVLGVNATLANPTNLSDGMVFNFRIKQDATGSRTLAYGSKYKFAGGVAGVLSTAANATDLLSCYYDSTNDVLLCSLSKGFA